MVPKAEPVVGGEEERRAAELSRPGEKRLRDFAALRCLSRFLLSARRRDDGPGLARFPPPPPGFVAFEAFSPREVSAWLCKSTAWSKLDGKPPLFSYIDSYGSSWAETAELLSVPRQKVLSFGIKFQVTTIGGGEMQKEIRGGKVCFFVCVSGLW